MSGVQVKTYLFPDNQKASLASLSNVEEIRRFNLALDVDENGLYKKLIEKIMQAYGTMLPNKEEVRTYWQDDEGELIGFTSDGELQYAIDVITAMNMSKVSYEKSVLLKVYVAKKPTDNNQSKGCRFGKEKTDGPHIHFGVVCDACDGSIIGNRYKCTVCPDYDLCEECNDKELHKEHVMNKMTRPMYPGCSFGRRAGGPGRWQRKMNGNEKRCNRNGPFETIINDFANFGPQFVPFVNNPEQLKNFGENLKKILDPFGIDVSYYVDNLTNNEEAAKKSAEKTSQKENKSKEKTSEKEKESSNQDKNQKVGEEQAMEINPEAPSNKEKTPETIRRSSSSLLMDEPVLIEKHSDETATSQKNPEKQQTPMETSNLIDLQRSVNPSAPYDAAINALKDVATANYEQQVTKEPTAPSSSDSTMVDDFNLIDIENELKIIKTIETLKSMGYSDDGGWLTRLVSAKGGNINKVLDAISPNRN